MKKIIPGLLLVSCIILFTYVFYLWIHVSEDNAISLETKLLIAASILSVLCLMALYYFQKKGYLNSKFIHFLALLFSIAFLVGVSLLLYASYNTYSKRLKSLETNNLLVNNIINKANFTSEEIQFYNHLKDNRNRLLGYVVFLKETAQNYNPNNYSYANMLKTDQIEQLSNKAGTQTYWNEILNNVYVLDSISNTYKRGGYEIMYAFANDEYPNEDLGNTTDKDLIYNTSVREYWQTQILNADRSPENIESFWRNNKAFLYTFFSKSQYDRLCKQVVDDLITVKEKINEQPNYKEFYEKYDISDPKFLTFPDKKFVKTFKYSWPFSFWDRRYKEGNDAVIYKILEEIQFHYKN